MRSSKVAMISAAKVRNSSLYNYSDLTFVRGCVCTCAYEREVTGSQLTWAIFYLHARLSNIRGVKVGLSVDVSHGIGRRQEHKLTEQT